MTQLKATAGKNVIALIDEKPSVLDAEAIGSLCGPFDRDKSDTSGSPGKKERIAFWSRIEELRGFEDRCRQRRGRGWFYRYLNAIFRFRDDLKSWQERELFKYCRYHLRPKRRNAYDEFRILIELTSTADHKSLSRWAQALRYAFANRDDWEFDKTLKKFFDENGGVSGCARKQARPRKKKKPNKQVRYWA